MVSRQPGCEGAVPSSWPDRPTWCRHILSDRSRVVRAGCNSDGPALRPRPFGIIRRRGSNCRADDSVVSGVFSFQQWQPGVPHGGVDSELAWFDRTGRQLGLAGKRGQYRNPELSLDGKFVAFSRGQPPDLWVRDIERGLDTRLTSHAAADHTPIWSPDMRNLAFFSARQDGTLFVLAVGGIGEGTVLLESQIGPIPADWSRDGRHLIYQFDGDVWASHTRANNVKAGTRNPDSLSGKQSTPFIRRSMDRLHIGPVRRATDVYSPIVPTIGSLTVKCPSLEVRRPDGVLMAKNCSTSRPTFR